ncbi:MAG: hypothetical protein ACM37W_01395 [Actinomycetota bacterium]
MVSNAPQSQVDFPLQESLQLSTTLLASTPMDSDSRLSELAKSPPDSQQISSLAVSWAKKYYSTVAAYNQRKQQKTSETFQPLEFEGNRARTVDKLADTLKVACNLAWNKVETLLGEDIERHAISPDLINPAQIIADTRNLYRKALEAFAEQEPAARLAVLVGRELIEMRKKYSQADPLVLGFVTMQVHYVGQMLLGCLSHEERSLFVPYLKIIDDYLHIPFGNIHQAAANHDANSKALLAVQHLLSCTTPIAHAVYERVNLQHQGYRSSSGYLNDLMVKLSGIRDVEIFQSYLCLCALENSVQPVQEELFPICVMLYPRLHVKWKLVQDMLMALFWEIHDRLSPEDVLIFLPYLRTLTEMFSDEIFQDS